MEIKPMTRQEQMRRLRLQNASIIDLTALPSGRITSSVYGGSPFQPRAVVILDAMIQGHDRFFIERDKLPADVLILTPRPPAPVYDIDEVEAREHARIPARLG